MTFDRDLMDIARRQHGAVAWRQLSQRGYDHAAIQHRIEKGILERATPAVMTVTATTDSRARQAMVAVLEVGEDALLSHTSAASWWRISGFRLFPLHVTIERNRRWRLLDGVQVHHATIVHQSDRRILDGVPITSPALTLLHLASLLPPSRLEVAVDSAWSLGLVDREALDGILDRMSKQGRNGVVALREILHARPEDWTPPQSNLESRFLHLAAEHGLGRFDCQVQLRTDNWKGRVDFRSKDLPIVIEVQSERYHAAISDRARDLRRRKSIESLGYTLVEVWDNDLFHDAEGVVDRIRDLEGAMTARTVRCGR